jgi:AhpD family alkylhydroperoxidase
MTSVSEFNNYRNRMNERILSRNNKIIKRLFNLDTNAYEEGSLDERTKEMIGLSCSLVLKCDDCVRYHLGKCYELEITSEEIMECMSVATLIGGTIIIPHLRKAVEYWDELQENAEKGS